MSSRYLCLFIRVYGHVVGEIREKQTMKITGWAFELGPSDNAPPRNLNAKARSLFSPSDLGNRGTIIKIEQRGMDWDPLTMEDRPSYEWPQYISASPGYKTEPTADHNILARFRIAKIKGERFVYQNFEHYPDVLGCNISESEATHQFRWLIK